MTNKWTSTNYTPSDGSSIWVIVREWDNINHHVDYGVVFYDTDGPVMRRYESSEYEQWPPPDVVAWQTCEIPEIILPMNRKDWTLEATEAVQKLNIGCPSFVEALCEHVAKMDDAPEVTTEHVNTVLAWMASTRVE